MKRIKKTKIIATLGPATSSVESIESLIKEGVDVLRINFSHSTHKEAEKMIREIREVNDSLSTNTAILADLQGPKLRIGEVSANTELKDGDNIFIFKKFKINSFFIYFPFKTRSFIFTINKNIIF